MFIILALLIMIVAICMSFWEVKVGIVSMMKDPKNIETWLGHHRKMGISKFYIRLEDTPGLEKFLKSQSDVHLIIGNSTGINEYQEIQVRQTYMVDECLKIAKNDGIDWLIHIDSDELLEGDISEIQNLPSNVHTIVLDNVEAKFESIPSSQDNCFDAKKFLDCKNEACVSYVNGKGGGRTYQNVSSFGPHRFRSVAPDSEKNVKMYVKHYESCDFEMYKQKYLHLAHSNKDLNIPFPYYRESIEAAKQGDQQLQNVFIKYRVT
jgi:Glycosyl transferase family 2